MDGLIGWRALEDDLSGWSSGGGVLNCQQWWQRDSLDDKIRWNDGGGVLGGIEADKGGAGTSVYWSAELPGAFLRLILPSSNASTFQMNENG